MPIEFELARDVPAETSLVVWGVTADALGAPVDGRDVSPDYLAARGFKGRVGQTFAVPGHDGGPATLVVGLGPADELGPNVVRRAGGAIARAARRDRVVAVRLLDAIAEPARRPAAAAALAEGIVGGSYRFATYKSAPEVDAPALERVVVIGGGGQRLRDQLVLGARIAGGVALARDLVNTPGGDLTPEKLADAATEIAEREGFDVSVLAHEGIIEAGLGGLLGVNRGSTQPARFIQITYTPPGARGSLALVGKGITFDSGGLSIKTAAGMTTMKDDMGGAAAILGALSVVTAVKPKVAIRAYIPATDNMTGGDATRVGDVLRIRNGKTVEVLNTDAEGRLVLADGLSMASEAEPDAIVDLATLTGAVEVALGKSVAGLMANHAGWAEQVAEAGDKVGERTWTLPLVEDYRSHLDSEVADLRNIGRPGQAGTIIAGLFLREFVADGIPWAHLDIAGTAWSDSDDLDLSKGGTGWGVRLLVELVRSFRRPARR